MFEAPNQAPHLDGEVISALRDLGGDGTPAFLHELIDAYLSDAPAKMEAIGTAMAAGDSTALHRAAHALKGSSGNMGAAALFSACDALQAAAKAGDFTASSRIFGGLRGEFALVERELRALRSQD